MSEHIRRGACPTTHKRIYVTRADAKKSIQYHHLKEVVVYKCDDCGYFHAGGWHGIKDRAAHRGNNIPTETISADIAALKLGVSVAFIDRLISTNKVRSLDGAPYRADIERILNT